MLIDRIFELVDKLTELVKVLSRNKFVVLGFGGLLVWGQDIFAVVFDLA